MTDYFRFNWYGLLNIFAGFYNLGLGSFILWKGTQSRINRSYFFVTWTAFIWVTGFGMASLTQRAEDADFWSRISYFIGVPFISPAVYNFTETWINKRKQNNLIPLSFFLASILAIPWIFFSDLVWTNKDFLWGRYTVYTHTRFSNYYVFTLISFFWTYAFLALRNFYCGWKNENDPERKRQNRNILIGYLIAYTGGIDFVTALTGKYYPFGFISLTLLTSITAYNIVRYQFLDIKLVLKKITLATLIYAILVGLSFVIGFPVINGIISDSSNLTTMRFLSILIPLAGILSTGPFIYAYLVKKSVWLKNHLSVGLTHELKSPLSNIQSSIELLMEKLKENKNGDQNLLDYAQMVKKNSDRLDLFVKNLLDLVRMNEGDLEITKTKADLNACVNKCVDFYRQAASLKGLRIETQMSSLPKIKFDADKIHQSLSNLMSNAVKFSDKGKITVGTKIEGKNVVCWIQDESRGIHQKDLNRVFERFYQGNKNSQGTGIGLSIAKGWIEAHGGKICGEIQKKNRGTIFSFSLPIN